MALAIRNTGGVPFLILRGTFVVRKGQQPDGDTVSFASNSPFSTKQVQVDVPVDKSGLTTVNLRLQSIDAPEKTQPRGATSRDALLKHLGFDAATLGLGDSDFTANPAAPVKRAGWIATHGMDNYDRVLAYLFTKSPGMKHGSEVSAARVGEMLASTANYRLVKAGDTFPAFYNNTEESHAVLFQEAARAARKARKGVWGSDKTTTGFVPTKDALGPKGTLAYPKFYRRVLEWKQAEPNGAAFIEWLKKQDGGKKLVYGAERHGIPLWKLFVVAGTNKVAVPYDVTKLWFSE